MASENFLQVARDELARAAAHANAVRLRWADLLSALDRRVEANARLRECQLACRRAASRLRLTGIPLDPRALKAAHETALEQAHMEVKAAKHVLRDAEAALAKEQQPSNPN